MRAGTPLDTFEIEAVIGASGFGIVYLARDLAFDRHVAIKEYLPDSLALRGDDGLQVLLRAPTHADAFERGRRAFIDEAELLSRCDHPSLLRVLRHWEANGTAYRAMPHYHGTALLALRQAMHKPPDEASLRAMLDGLTEALETLHAAGCIHREITPASILLLPDDRPLLMDCGAARRAIVGDQARALMTLLAPSFAPPEQTAPAAGRPLGPWTDLYALAAVVRYCISGQLPPPAALRTMPADEPIGRLVARLQRTDPEVHYSPWFVAAIDAALAPRPEDRPQSVAEFRARLDDHPAARGERMADAASSWGQPTDNEPWFAPTQAAGGDDAQDEELDPAETPWPLDADAAAAEAAAATQAEPASPPPGEPIAEPIDLPATAAEPAALRSTLPPAPLRHPDSAWAATRAPLGDEAPRAAAPDEPLFTRPADYRATPPSLQSYHEVGRRRRRRFAVSTVALLLL
ncbi:MAG TPA: protein kinase, partial [Albitalea sp.]|nr:protein kinase [Albitalea sp.]